MEVLKASSNSNPGSIAGAIAVAIKEQGKTEIQAIGAGAVNQAVKGIAIASGLLAPQGIEITSKVGFTDIYIDNEKKTAIKIKVEEK